MTQEYATKDHAREVAERRRADLDYEEWLREVWAEQADDELHHDMSATLRVVQQIDAVAG